MLCKDLKVVSLNITEDHYEFKALFRLCTDGRCIDVDLAQLSSDERLFDEIKREFEIEESIEEIKKVIMEKVMEASTLESKIVEGHECCEEKETEKIDRVLGSLNAI